MLSPVNGFRALGVATLLFINHICTLARLCGADERFADLYQETRVQRPSTRTAVTAEANHALSVLKWSNKEEGILSGTGERRLHAEEKEGVQLSWAIGGVPARSLKSQYATEDAVGIRTPDAESSTTLSSSVERTVDARRERRTHLAIKNKENGRHRRRHLPKETLTGHHDDKGNPSSSSTRRRMSARYSKGWKALWIAGTITSIALMVSGFRAADQRFLRFLRRCGGRLPRWASDEDRRQYNALAGLPLGLHILFLTGASFLAKWFATRKREPSGPQQSKPLRRKK